MSHLRSDILIKLFVYGGLLVPSIRRKKGIKFVTARPFRLYGYRTRYTRKVKNRKDSMFYSPRYRTGQYLGMLCLENGNPQESVVGVIAYVTPPQLKKIRKEEPGYRLKVVYGHDVFSLMCCKCPKFVNPHIPRNPVYARYVEDAVAKLRV